MSTIKGKRLTQARFRDQEVYSWSCGTKASGRAVVFTFLDGKVEIHVNPRARKSRLPEDVRLAVVDWVKAQRAVA
jgi:hypothetical protein